MASRVPARGLRALGCLSPNQAPHISAVSASLSAYRSLSTLTADQSLLPSTSAPSLPPSLRELQATIRAPQSLAVSALDKQIGLSSSHEESKSSAELDDALCRHLLRSNQLTPGQLDTLRLLQRYNSGLPSLRGQTILAKVLAVDSTRVLVDTGYSGPSELPRVDVTVAHVYTDDGETSARLSTNDVRPGDRVRLRVDSLYTPYGDMQLTAVRDDTEQQRRLVWKELRRLMEEKQVVSGRVLNECPGGFSVGIAGFVAMLPAALAATPTTKLVGVRQKFVIIAMEDGRQRITLRDPTMQRAGRR